VREKGGEERRKKRGEGDRGKEIRRMAEIATGDGLDGPVNSERAWRTRGKDSGERKEGEERRDSMTSIARSCAGGEGEVETIVMSWKMVE
jgi:hypothetical protein